MPDAHARVGYVYVPAQDAGPMRFAKAGATVRNPDAGPSWIVVDHTLLSVVVAHWPGRLWQVQVLQAAADQPIAAARYTRAVAVQVLAEVNLAQLFGEQGAAVVALIEAANQLTLTTAQQLVDCQNRVAAAVYSAAWNRWLLALAPQSQHCGCNHQHTLAIPAAEGQSPVGQGLLVIHQALRARALTLQGPAALTRDQRDDDDGCLVEPWSSANAALLHAALALGASQWLSSAEQELLLAAWRSLEHAA